IFGHVAPQGNYDVAMAVNPTDANVVYVLGKADGSGGVFGTGQNPNSFIASATKLMRVDISTMADANAFYLGNSNNDGGLLRSNSTGPAQLKNPINPPAVFLANLGSPNSNPILNLLRDPSNPFLANATIYVSNTQRFSNPGTGAKWIPFDGLSPTGDDYHYITTIRDPLTGLSRLIVADDHSINTAVDNNGVFLTS